MSETAPEARFEDRVVLETERIEIIRGLNCNGDTITVVRGSKPGGGAPSRHDAHGMLGTCGYFVDREDWGKP